MKSDSLPKVGRLVCLTVLLSLSGAAGSAAPKPKPITIRFARNKTSASLKGTLPAGKQAVYRFDAVMGQTVSVQLHSEQGDGRFTAHAEGMEEPHWRASKVKVWNDTLSTIGPHEITVYAGKSPLTYSLNVDIRNTVYTKVLGSISGYFDFEVEVHNYRNEYGPCGPGNVRVLYPKGTHTVLQTLPMERIDLAALSVKYAKSVPKHEVFMSVEDFNFDGYEDLAVCEANLWNHFRSSYRLFLWDPVAATFRPDPELDYLTRYPYIGLCELDPKKKLITVRRANEDDLLTHTERYRLDGGKPVMVEEETADNRGKVGKRTRKRMVAGKWVTEVVRYPIKPSDRLSIRFKEREPVPASAP